MTYGLGAGEGGGGWIIDNLPWLELMKDQSIDLPLSLDSSNENYC